MELNLSNKSNYRKKINVEDLNEYFNTYTELLSQMLLHISSKVVIQNQEYHKYVITQGINTFFHIFSQLLLFTKNIELTILYIEKAICYYVEFISQISDENHSYLKLNCKDAILFVYKKTIFNINHEYRKTFDINQYERDILSTFNSLLLEYNNLLIQIIQNNQSILHDGNSLELLGFLVTQVKKIQNNIYDDNNISIKDILNEYSLLNRITFELLNKEESLVRIFHILVLIIKKQCNRKLHEDKIVEKLCSMSYETLSSISPLRIVNRIIQ